ncbi:MAG: PBP1A family penicillin-binding protein [bacterium]|nr:PBP1A family penicillin-binding protein [bacterium]
MARLGQRSALRIAGTWVVAACTIGGLAAAGALLSPTLQALPEVEQLREYHPPGVTRILAADGTLVGELWEERRLPVPLARVPLHVRQAFLAAEDVGFYGHWGIDVRGVARAAWVNLQRGGVAQGGSTITQQIVKALLLGPERSWTRKTKELVLALHLEHVLGKDEILALYLNQIYFGRGAYGVQAAAEAFFAKDVADLTAAEAALLASLPRAPTHYDPDRRPKRARARQEWVLARMHRAGFLSTVEWLAAREQPTVLAPRRTPPAVLAAPWYVEHVRRVLEEHYGNAARQLGLTVWTALDLGMQAKAEAALRDGLVVVDRRQPHRRGRPRAAEPTIEGALVAMVPGTGEVTALVGGWDPARSQWNRATQARRQPGSAFKPLVYAAALEHGFTATSRVLDGPITFGRGRGAWSPQNYGGRYYGRVSLREALARSLNTVSVRLLDGIGLDDALATFVKFGIPGPLPKNLSIALGTHEVTLLDLVAAYSVFPNLGERVEPVFVTEVRNAAGERVPFPGTLGERRTKVMDPAPAYVMTSLLESVVTRGSGREAASLGRPAAGKTGTTNDAKDAWFIGYTAELLAGVWVGYDDARPMGARETGGRAATPIWTDFMARALADVPIGDFTVPQDVLFVNVEPWSGLRATAGTPARLEPFVQGTEPTEFARVRIPKPEPEAEEPPVATAPQYVDATASAPPPPVP